MKNLLVLNKKTIAKLNERQLSAIKGGKNYADVTCRDGAITVVGSGDDATCRDGGVTIVRQKFS